MRHAFLWEMCTGRFIGDNCQIRRPEAISVFGISLNTTCTDRFFFEISGCGVRDAGCGEVFRRCGTLFGVRCQTQMKLTDETFLEKLTLSAGRRLSLRESSAKR